MSLYDTFMKTAGATSDLRKWAEAAHKQDAEVAYHAQQAMAKVANDSYDRIVKVASAAYAEGRTAPQDLAKAVVIYAEKHAETIRPNEKVASARGEFLSKLETAAFVDAILTEKIAEDGDNKDMYAGMRSLGREYCMHLIGCVID